MNNFNLFGIGPMELIFVLIIALVVMGPERLPQAAREMAKMMAYIREIYSEIMSTLTKEFGDMEELKEIQRDFNSLREPLNFNKLVNPSSKSPAKTASSTPKGSTAEQVAQPTATAAASPPVLTETSKPLAPANNAVTASPAGADAGEENRIAPPQSPEPTAKTATDSQAESAPITPGDES